MSNTDAGRVSTGSHIDPDYEFDAPTFKDFSAGTPAKTQASDAWFDHRKGSALPEDLMQLGEEEFEEGDSLHTAGEDEMMEEEEEVKAGMPKPSPHVNASGGKKVASTPKASTMTGSTPVRKAAVAAAKAIAASSSSAIKPKATTKAVPRYLMPTQAAAAKRKGAAANEVVMSTPRRHGHAAGRDSMMTTASSISSVAPVRRAAKVAIQRMSSTKKPRSALEAKARASKFAGVKKVIEKPKRTIPRTPQFKTNARRRAHDLELEAERKAAEEHERKMKEKMNHLGHELSITDCGLTCPKTPQFQTKSRAREPRVKPTEEMRMEQLEKEVEEISKRRRMNKKTMEKALIGGAGKAMPVRSPKPLTEPKEFTFATDQRVQSSSLHNQSHESVSDAGTHATFAEMVQNFNRTPKRFHSKPSNMSTDSFQSGQRGERWVPKLTNPREFNLSTNERATVKSSLSGEVGAPLSGTRAAKEMEELKECEKKVKARKLDKRIFESHGELGVPRIEKKGQTVVEEFNLATNMRGMTRSERRKYMEENKVTFKARPLSEKVMRGETFTTSVEKKSLTSFEPFKLATDERGTLHTAQLQSKLEEEQSKEVFEPFKARPLPASKPFMPKHEVREPTRAEGFHLRSEERHEQYIAQKQAELEREEEEKERQMHFKARPLPLAEPLIPKPSERPLTEPQPFHLRSEQLAKEAERKFREQAEAELRRDLENFSNFKARDVPLSHRSPYSAKKSTKPLTEIADFDLNSSGRAEKRKTFDSFVKEKETAAEEQKRLQEMEKEKEEQAEIKRLRRSMNFKATPITEGKPIEVQKSNRPLTVASSPKLRTSRRSAIRNLV